MSSPLVTSVLGHFPSLGAIGRVEPLANAGGFSGSQLWKVRAASGENCLRRWPEETTAERLAFIHAFQRHLRGAGLTFVPLPQMTASGETFVEHDGRLWEVVSWMPGKADYHEQPSPARLTAAMQALARIHAAAAMIAGQSRVGTSPGLAARLDQLRKLRAGSIERIEAAVDRRPLAWDELARLVCRKFRQHAPQVERELAAAATVNGPLFPCLRDIWHDHVLFTGDEVTGIIDFGAARVESPAGDIARLLGSFVGDDADGWRAGLAAYDGVGSLFRPTTFHFPRSLAEKDSRPLLAASMLTADQRQLIRTFDSSGVLLAGINWLTWLYVEQRQFEDAAAVTRRLAEIAARLERAT